MRLPRPTPPAPPDKASARRPVWLRRLLLLGGLACLALALVGFIVFALRAVSIA
jgi:hypothetical protein